MAREVTEFDKLVRRTAVAVLTAESSKDRDAVFDAALSELHDDAATLATFAWDVCVTVCEFVGALRGFGEFQKVLEVYFGTLGMGAARDD